MKNVFIAFGANLGDRENNILRAISLMRDSPFIDVLKVSSYMETDAVGGPDGQGKYLNGVVKCKTSLLPHELLKFLNDIENELGRVRNVRNGPRPIDLDILLYGSEEINTVNLIIPHPRMFERNFVLKPLLEIDEDIVNQHSLVNKHKKEINRVLYS